MDLAALSEPAQQLAKPLQLTPDQDAALRTITAFAQGTHGARQMTLEGYAGTGKTTLVSQLLRNLGGSIDIAVAAPTNKAVAVLREKIAAAGADHPSIEYGSIHSFLGLRLKEREDGRHECLPEGSCVVHKYDLLIVDECSMLGRDLYGQLLIAIARSDARVLFVGDPAQLNPVGDRNESPTFKEVQHRAVLTTVVRQARDNPIIRVSMAIRASIERMARMTPAALMEACPPAPANALFTAGGHNTAYNWALSDIMEGQNTRILAFRNATVQRYNAEIHHAIHGSATPFAIGQTVMANEAHDEARDRDGLKKIHLHNSEEMEVLGIEREGHPRHPGVDSWKLTLKRDSGEIATCYIADNPRQLQSEISQCFNEAARLKAELQNTRDTEKDRRRKDLIGRGWALRNDFAGIRHTYAMTVHKSQGSTFFTAIVDLSDLNAIRDDQEFNRALYVATTRPSERLAFVA